LSDQGKQRLAQRDADLKRRGILITNRTELNSIVGRNARYDQAQNNSLDDRCIITGQAGPPMVPGGYNSGYQFVQSPGWVMVLIENNHIARMIPTDGRPGLPQNVRGWTGVSRGHWEGNTLVVQTTNITTDLAFPGNAQPASGMDQREHESDGVVHAWTPTRSTTSSRSTIRRRTRPDRRYPSGGLGPFYMRATRVMFDDQWFHRCPNTEKKARSAKKGSNQNENLALTEASGPSSPFWPKLGLLMLLNVARRDAVPRAPP
jgi:hypothetical protein